MKSKFENKKIYSSFKQLASPSYLNEVNNKKRIVYEIIRIFLSGLLCFIVVQFFVKGLFFSTGLTGLSIIFSDFGANMFSVIKDNNFYKASILYGSFFLINIPLLFYAWPRLERTLFWYSFLYIIIFSFSGFLFNIFYHPSANSNVFIFIFSSKLESSMNYFLYHNKGPDAEFFGYIATSIVLAIMGGLLFGIGLSITYSSRGSTAGTDFPIIYYSIKKGVGLGKINFYVNASIVIFGAIFLYFSDPLHTKWHYNFLQYITSYKLIATIIYIILYSWSLDLFFPRNRKVSLQIVTSKADEIASELFDKKKFNHTLTKVNAMGMYKKSSKDILYCTLTYFEYYRFITYIKNIDPNLFCTATITNDIIGNFVSSKKFN